MKTKITETNEKDLLKTLSEKRVELANFKFGVGAKAKNVKLARDLRRQIARLLTKLNGLAK